MSVDYAALMGSIAGALALLAPDRVVTRTYRDFEQHAHEDLESGVFTVLAGGVSRYPTDWCDTLDAEGPTATALPVFAFRILGQGVLAEGADGADIEAAEFALMAEIEALASTLVSDESLPGHEELCRTVLRGIDQSNQLEAPYYWVTALFALDITR